MRSRERAARAAQSILQELEPDAVIRLGFPFWLRPFVLDGVAGVTIGRHVFLHPSVADLPETRLFAILRHEGAHLNQYRRYGVIPFLTRYVFEYMSNRLRGMSSWDAYKEITFEKEAFAEEQKEQRVHA